MNAPQWLLAALLLCGTLTAQGALAGDVVARTNGERLEGQVLFQDGTWRVGKKPVVAAEVLWAAFTPVPPPEKIAAGVFLRGGSLVVGSLDSVIGDGASVNATSLGPELKLKREDLAGAFFPLPPGEVENLPVLGSYGRVAAVLDGLASGEVEAKRDDELRIQPGSRDRVTYANLDALDGRLLRLGGEKALFALPSGEVAAPKRDLLRVVEMKAAAPAPPSPEELKLGPEWVVRLKAGDVLRGRILKLDLRSLELTTRWGGTVTLARSLLAALYASASKGGPVTWLASLKPVRQQQTPMFDAQFPMRPNLSCEGRFIRLPGLACDRGLGVHAKSELTYSLAEGQKRRFVAWVGLDDETQGRGSAQAKVFADGREVWASAPLVPRAAPQAVSVNLGTARELRLLVDFGPDGNDSGAHVDWGWAAVVNEVP